jgi:hypothetical protein
MIKIQISHSYVMGWSNNRSSDIIIFIDQKDFLATSKDVKLERCYGVTSTYGSIYQMMVAMHFPTLAHPFYHDQGHIEWFLLLWCFHVTEQHKHNLNNISAPST